jgi:hypothetical protein
MIFSRAQMKRAAATCLDNRYWESVLIPLPWRREHPHQRVPSTVPLFSCEACMVHTKRSALGWLACVCSLPLPGVAPLTASYLWRPTQSPLSSLSPLTPLLAYLPRHPSCIPSSSQCASSDDALLVVLPRVDGWCSRCLLVVRLIPFVQLVRTRIVSMVKGSNTRTDQRPSGLVRTSRHAAARRRPPRCTTARQEKRSKLILNIAACRSMLFWPSTHITRLISSIQV